MIAKETKNRLTLFMFICSILIVFYHSAWVGTEVKGGGINRILNFIYNYEKVGLFEFVLPAFFFVSGMLFFCNYDNNNIFIKWKRRIKSLVVPYLFYNALLLLFHLLCAAIPFIRSFFLHYTFYKPSIANVIEGVFLYKFNAPYWYMMNLILLASFAPVLYLFIKNRGIGMLYLAFIYLLTCFGGGFSYHYLYFSIAGLFYYSLGAYLGVHYIKIVNLTVDKKYRPFFIIIFFLNTVFTSVVDVPSFVELITNVISFLSLWIVIGTFKVHNCYWWVKNSFFIYSTHFYLVVAINRLLSILQPDKIIFLFFISYIGGAIFTTVLIEILAFIIKKYTPSFWNVLNGWR